MRKAADVAKIQGRVLALLKRYGHNTTSFQILEPGLQYWFDGDGDDEACVAYADTGGSWVAAGGPICAPEREVEVMQRFTAAARAAGKRARFFGLEHEAAGSDAFARLHVGAQPVWDPQRWSDAVASKRSLREQLRRARAKGVVVRQVGAGELTEPTHPTRVAIDRMVAHWLDSRAMAPMGFVVHLDPYNLPEERRFFVAERAGIVVGILIAVPIYARGGWFFEDVLRDPSAPNGTVELMFDHAMHVVAREGSTHATFGLAPLANIEHRWLQRIRDRTRWLYDFEGLRQFKAKLLPTAWQPVYLAYPARERGISAVIDILEAFARGSFVRFGWRTLIHRARLVARILGLLLLPWIAVLALVPAAEWFPSVAVQRGWITLDVILFVLLMVLSTQWRKPLALGLAALAAADFGLGCVQLALHTAPHIHGWFEWLVVAAAQGAPLFAALFLFAARGRDRMYEKPT